MRGIERRFAGAQELNKPMSKYLNDLIKSLQAEAKEHQVALQQDAIGTTRRFHRANRLLQRIKSLRQLQLSEAKRRARFREALVMGALQRSRGEMQAKLAFGR
jgi:hypothetical protein